jgi:hypothetical protein
MRQHTSRIGDGSDELSLHRFIVALIFPNASTRKGESNAMQGKENVVGVLHPDASSAKIAYIPKHLLATADRNPPDLGPWLSGANALIANRM